MNISVRKTVARLVVCSAIILQCIEKVTVYYCGLQVVPYLTCMLCWLHVSRCSQKLKKKEWQLFPDWLPSHQNMYVFLFSPICYICLYEFMMKKIAKWEFVAGCLHFCYSFTGNKKKGRGWLLIYRGWAVQSSVAESQGEQVLQTTAIFLRSLVAVQMVRTTSNNESLSSGFSTFCQNVFCLGHWENRKSLWVKFFLAESTPAVT